MPFSRTWKVLGKGGFQNGYRKVLDFLCNEGRAHKDS